MDELHDEGGEPVVVAEREAADLLVRDDVVLVDDRHDARAHEVVQRTAEIGDAAAVREVGVREQHLAHLHVARGEVLFVFGNEARLAHGRAHLHVRDIGGARLQAERLDARRDGAGRDEEDLEPGPAQRADAVDHAPQRGVVRAARLLGDRVRADLDHHAAGVLQHRAFLPKIVHRFHLSSYYSKNAAPEGGVPRGPRNAALGFGLRRRAGGARSASP